ncbi:putative dihydrolipoamide dehydrogenase, putative,acetoin dehydrogenase e3 component [Trypanosoma theileri]|uniref:Putative dihydrolipoamide dehydrogenase, putative,acetoin dehydrogenase e3 component n=1 Tax=Trypanosoma theileri TaxID=67003 RepID=A0A1X0NJ18_9TRYP|nr:putative dihydrolipoamide dehydrogenase, putative,acetoin dehydrogenase e3 component [Trypanosoma theileri]ORC84518.1 putative dihydrolipoamide dehydrogenase, putative,acetoin dehydrogenase e3 component [Trypanosoma theileri]
MLRRTFFSLCSVPSSMRWKPILDVAHFDVCVIGAGPAGVSAALRAVDYKKRVCLVEKKRIGGCDLWNGALQSKVMWEMSNFLAKANGSAAQRVYNTTISQYMELDEERMRETLIKASTMREKQILAALEAAGVTLMYGRAFFASPRELEVRNRDTREYRTLTADYFIIATGSTPVEHPYVAVDHKRVVTSDDIMMMPLPKSMVIVGAGVLGSEFAAIYARLGTTKVYLLDKEECIMPKEDDDIVAKIQESMEKHGVVIHQDSILYNMQSWEENEEETSEHPEDPTPRSGVRYTIMNRKTRELCTYEVERALIAIGRQPFYHGLGLQNAKCKVRDGILVLDDFGMCEGQNHIYAIGDAAGDSKLVSVGEARGQLVIDRIYGVQRVHPLRHDFTRLIFLTIAVASVGMNEKLCRSQNLSYIMAKYSFELCSRTIAADSTTGFVKILATNDSSKTLLGVRVVGTNASTIIELASAAIKKKQSAYEFSELVTAYPSVSQAFLECLRVILGSSTLKPGTFPGLVCETWTPSGYERGRAYKDSTDTSKEEEEEEENDEDEDEGNVESTRERNAQKASNAFMERVKQMSTEELYEAKRVTEAIETAAVGKSNVESTSSSSNPNTSTPTTTSSSSASVYPTPGSFFH